MAERVIESNYGEMISALYTFASNVYTKASEMQTVASVAASALGDEDSGVAETYKKLRECQLKYCEAVDMAKHIAATMQEELDEIKKEREIWESDLDD